LYPVYAKIIRSRNFGLKNHDVEKEFLRDSIFAVRRGKRKEERGMGE
jgi:hypothetical protein